MENARLERRCPFCGKIFKQAGALNGHISLKHTKKTPRFTGKGRTLSEEHKRKIAKSEEKSKSEWSLERREKFRISTSVGAKKRWVNPEYREKISRRIKELWDSGHFRRELTEQERNKLSDAIKKKWSNPEYRLKVVTSLRKKKDVLEIHDMAILKKMEQLMIEGYRCIPIGIRVIPIPDIIALSPDGKIIFHEIRNKDKHKRIFRKYEGFEPLFDKIEVYDIHFGAKMRE